MVSVRLLVGTALFSIAAAQKVSNTGRCGANYGLTCAGSSFGKCCSSNGWCGSTSDYCGQGCKTGFGICGSNPPAPSSNPTTKPVSKDERCGSQYKGQTCQGSAFGNCCSQYGYCGRSNDYCAATSCQKDFGTCNGGQAPSAPGNTLSTIVVRPSSQNPQPTAAPSTVTVTVSGAAPTCPARTTVTLPGKETTLTIPGAGQVTTVIVPASTITITVPTTVAQSASTITVPGEGVTITIPGEGEVVTVTVPTTVAQSASTITVPGEDVTITVPTTLAGEVVTITVPTTLAGEVVTVPTTLAGDVVTVPTTLAGEVITITVPTTLAGEIVTVPTTLAGEVVTVTATPLPASTVTVTETSTATATPTSPGGFQCSAPSGSNAILNPGFENALSGSWVTFTSSPGDIAERQALGADGSSFSFRSRISSTNSNTPQRLLQSVSLCPGTTYRLTFQARRATTAGSISVIGYAGVAGTAASPLVGGLVSSSVFQSAPEILGTITVPSGSAPVSGLVYLDITFSGGTGSAKEVAIDNVNLVVV